MTNLLHRSWLLRGNFNPSPWAKSMSGLLEETLVSFLRFPSVQNGLGGQEATGAAVVYLTAMCHVEIEEQPIKIVEPSPGIILMRNWSITMAMPEDLANVPVRGDRVQFTYADGLFYDSVLLKADVTEGVPDHVEMQTESWA